ncbi:alpha/beta hydrolase [Winogradskyella maritima]|uniref:Alpha/beta hydrolase family protein n=1 Tax=Winogradskyella maritima TaxID=1517766 RepID=A0ABV8AJR3_9FLAO|nr:alpha/beta hydrolase [Winogradskyella maritima]
MKIILAVLLFMSVQFSWSQEQPFLSMDIEVTEWIDGTLFLPNAVEKPDLVIIIAGSGPTNRNGNQNFFKNNALKKLAEALSSKGIATFRYDKRIVKQIKMGKVDKDMSFDDFVSDASDVIDYFKDKETYSKIYVAGHSQGSLVGMLAGKDQLDGFISLAGAGQNIGDVIIEQVDKTAPFFTESTKKVVASLKDGKKTKDYPKELGSMFREDLQEFMISWMKYNPTEELKDLDIPILIINGTKDLQVPETEAVLLKESNPKAELVIIENMNHVLFEIKGNDLENSKSYNESFRPISEELVSSILTFIESNQ